MNKKRPTIKDIAQKTGLSVSAVSKALHDAPDISEGAKQRVRQACQELGYVPNLNARNLVRGGSRTIGLVLTDLSAQGAVGLYKGVQQRLAGTPYQLFLADAGAEPAELPRMLTTMLEYQVEGLLVQPANGDTPQLNSIVHGMPCVYLDADAPDARSSICYSWEEIGAIAFRHLYELGHRNFVFATQTPDVARAQQLVGWQRAAAEYGLDPLLLQEEESDAVRAGCRIGALLAECQAPPLAVLAADDDVGAGVLAALANAGWTIPGDVSLVGAGDYPFAALPQIGLTTVRVDRTAQGSMATEHLLELLEDGAAARGTVYLPPRLVARGTTARIEPDRQPWRFPVQRNG